MVTAQRRILAGNQQEATGGLPQLNATGRNSTMSHKRDVAGLFSTDTLPTMQYELPSSKTIKQVHRWLPEAILLLTVAFATQVTLVSVGAGFLRVSLMASPVLQMHSSSPAKQAASWKSQAGASTKTGQPAAQGTKILPPASIKAARSQTGVPEAAAARGKALATLRPVLAC